MNANARPGIGLHIAPTLCTPAHTNSPEIIDTTPPVPNSGVPAGCEKWALFAASGSLPSTACNQSHRTWSLSADIAAVRASSAPTDCCHPLLARISASSQASPSGLQYERSNAPSMAASTCRKSQRLGSPEHPHLAKLSAKVERTAVL